MKGLSSILLLLFVASCCPKVTEVTKTVTKRDTVVTYRTDTVKLAGTTDTAYVQVSDLCDSLAQELTELRIQNEGSTLTIIKENGQFDFIIACDSLQAVIDSIKQIHVTDTIRITDTKVVTKYKRKGKWWVWLLVGAVGGLIVAIVIRR